MKKYKFAIAGLGRIGKIHLENQVNTKCRFSHQKGQPLWGGSVIGKSLYEQKVS